MVHSFLGMLRGVNPGLKTNGQKPSYSSPFTIVSWKSNSRNKKQCKDSKVGITLNLNTAIPASDSEHDKKACDFYDAQFNRLYLEPLYNQKYPELLFESLLQKNLIKQSDLTLLKTVILKQLLLKLTFSELIIIAEA